MFEQIILIIAQLAPPEEIGIPNQQLNEAALVPIMNVVYMIAGGVAVIVAVMGGILLITSSGEPAKAAKGRNAILYSAIGIVVVAMAYGITNLVIDRVL